jgi:hypothetical protein
VSAERPTLRRRREGAGLGQGGEWGTGAEAGERRGYRGAGGTQRIGGVEGERGRVTRGGRSRQGRVLHASLSAAHPRGRWVTGGAPGLQRGHVGAVLAGSGRPRVPRWRETAGRGGAVGGRGRCRGRRDRGGRRNSRGTGSEQRLEFFSCFYRFAEARQQEDDDRSVLALFELTFPLFAFLVVLVVRKPGGLLIKA